MSFMDLILQIEFPSMCEFHFKLLVSVQRINTITEIIHRLWLSSVQDRQMGASILHVEMLMME